MPCEFSTSSLWPLIRYLQNAPIYHGCHFEIPNLSEKSLQVQLDYSMIINHIQKAWNQILFTYLRSNEKGNEGGAACASVISVRNNVHVNAFDLKSFLIGSTIHFIGYINSCISILINNYWNILLIFDLLKRCE